MASRNALMLALLVLASFACSTQQSRSSKRTSGGTPDGVSDVTSAPVQKPFVGRAKLKMKRPELLERDLEGVLELSLKETCLDLGQPCFERHRIALGGTEAYEKNILRGAAAPSVAMTIAVERAVAASCMARLAADAKGGKTILLGKATDTDDAYVLATTRSLTQRFHARAASVEDVVAAKSLWTSIAAAAPPADRRASWAFALCFSLGTSTEFLFF